MATARERAEERREARLADVQQQVNDGTLTIRKMTPKERAENPPRPRPEHGRGSRRASG
jgi:hypothetical protein